MYEQELKEKIKRLEEEIALLKKVEILQKELEYLKARNPHPIQIMPYLPPSVVPYFPHYYTWTTTGRPPEIT